MFELGNLGRLPATLAAQPLPSAPEQIVEQIGSVEDAVNALRAHQARLALELAAIREAEAGPGRANDREEQRARLQRQRISVGAEVALARRISPHAGVRFVSLAKLLAAELPHTWTAFRRGHLSEARARSVAAGTVFLGLEHRRAVDATVAADPQVARSWGDRALRSAVRARASALDADAVVEQIKRAEGDRRVTLRPGHDHMTHLHAVLPIREGVACLAALKAAASRAVGSGEVTSHAQAMADILVARLTGRASDDGPVPITLRLVMRADALFGATDAPAVLTDGVDHTTWLDAIPAPLARAWVTECLDAGQQVAVKRLFTAPGSGELIAMESRARCFPPALAEAVAIRDGWCRTPFCDAPIRHIDHLRAHARGGPTALANGQGLCVQCNHAKEAPAWQHTPPDRPGTPIAIAAPTGHRHRARAPALP